MSDELAGKRVLVVEDEFLIAMLVEDILAEQGSVVVGPFSRVAAALVAAQTEMVDVALLDVNIAGELVFPVAEALEHRGVPFLFVSGYGDEALPPNRPGWKACHKPYDPNTLVRMLAARLLPA